MKMYLSLSFTLSTKILDLSLHITTTIPNGDAVGVDSAATNTTAAAANTTTTATGAAASTTIATASSTISPAVVVELLQTSEDDRN